MSIWQHWQQQKESLRVVLIPQLDAADAVRHIRHALLQTEQNALAEMTDDVLRQQASVLMGSLKGCTGLLEAHGTAQVWVANRRNASVRDVSRLWLISLALFALLMIVCVWRDEWLALAITAAALATTFCAWFSARRENVAFAQQEEVRATVTTDPDRVFAVLDTQLRAIDRCLNDFAALNEQARGSAENADTFTLSRAAELMEALYDCDEAQRAPAEEAARRLLDKLGLQAVDYTEENSRLFHTLPSKSMTRTLSPAIVSAQDQQLLRRGTAAVRMPAA